MPCGTDVLLAADLGVSVRSYPYEKIINPKWAHREQRCAADGSSTMIDRITIMNFKSVVRVAFDVPKFTVLIGMNGAGKTTLLQAFDFLSQLMEGRVDEWLENRNWTASDLGSKLSHTSNISFAVNYAIPDEVERRRPN